MSAVSEKSPTCFEHYLDLPTELRFMINEEMEPEDRCRFRRCSQLSNWEAKASKNYIYSLEFIGTSENELSIDVAHKESGPEENAGYTLKFEKKNEKNLMRCIVSEDKELWSDELDSSIDLVQHAAGHFKQLLKAHQNKIKHLCLYGALFNTILKNYDFEIKKLYKLEELTINGHMDYLSYFAKLRRPLKAFSLSGKVNSKILAERNEIYRIPNYLYMAETKFTNEQFLRLEASKAVLHIGDLTETDIFQFIKSWQKETIGKEVRSYKWTYLKKSKFDIVKLFQRFGVEFDENEERRKQEFEIKHEKKDGSTAKIVYVDNRFLLFQTRNRKK